MSFDFSTTPGQATVNEPTTKSYVTSRLEDLHFRRDSGNSYVIDIIVSVGEVDAEGVYNIYESYPVRLDADQSEGALTQSVGPGTLNAIVQQAVLDVYKAYGILPADGTVVDDFLT